MTLPFSSKTTKGAEHMTATDTPVNNGVNVDALLGARTALAQAPGLKS
jgi:hypothetical protein